MRKLRRASLVFPLVFSVLVFSQDVPKDFLSFPTRLEMDKSTVEVKKDATVTYTVWLKNARGEVVPARQDRRIEIQTPSGTRTAMIAKGQTSANFQWTAASEGMARMVVRLGNLLPASCLVVVTPAHMSAIRKEMLKGIAPTLTGEPAPASAAPIERRRFAKKARQREEADATVASQPAPPPPAPAPGAATPSSATLPQPSKIQIFVQPEPIFGNAVAHTWTATVAVAAQDDQDQLVPVPTDVAVHFTSNLGQIAKPDIVISHGQASTFNSPMTLVASRSGKDRLQAVSSLGSATADIEYQAPIPSRLGLVLGTPDFSPTGSSTAAVRVCLQDEAGNLTAYPDRDTQVNLSVNIGQLDKTLTSIAHGAFCSDPINWVSRSSGAATLLAQSSGELQSANEQITFPSFPWYLVLLAAVGGLAGAFVTTSAGLLTPHWWAHVWRNVVLGAALGVFFYLFACFGAIVLPQGLPIRLQNIPTVTGVGSLLLGFLGGLYGRKLWKVDDEKHEDAASAAA